MPNISIYKSIGCVLVIFLSTYVLAQQLEKDALPSWNNGNTKQTILNFVHQITDKTSPDYVPPEDRIATFDNDGTLWVEQPLYTQAIFSIDQIHAQASSHPEWKTQAPFNIILSNDKQKIAVLTTEDLAKILAVSHSGMTVDEFNVKVKNWFKTAENPHFKRPYTKVIYQPMLELMQYLRDNDFKIYIVTGGGQDFVRAISFDTYNIEPEYVIGSAGKTKYIYQNNKPVLIKQPDVLFIDDKTGKPEAINLFIAKKPLMAFGNSDGDKQMLEWTQSGSGQRLMMLVHHDDAKREYAYGPDSKIGTFSDALMQEATENHWGIISMERDWKTLFP